LDGLSRSDQKMPQMPSVGILSVANPSLSAIESTLKRVHIWVFIITQTQQCGGDKQSQFFLQSTGKKGEGVHFECTPKNATNLLMG